MRKWFARTLLENWRRLFWANKNFSKNIFSPEVWPEVSRQFINFSSQSKHHEFRQHSYVIRFRNFLGVHSKKGSAYFMPKNDVGQILQETNHNAIVKIWFFQSQAHQWCLGSIWYLSCRRELMPCRDHMEHFSELLPDLSGFVFLMWIKFVKWSSFGTRLSLS